MSADGRDEGAEGAVAIPETVATDVRVKIAFGVAGLLLLCLCEWLATREYFKLDDFYFLSRVRSADWSLLDTFLPASADRYWAVRPLGEPTWFFVASRLFGLQSFLWWQCALAVHVATGLVVARIARQLGVGAFGALAAGAIAIAAPPSLHLFWWGVGFAYLASILFAALAVSGFLTGLRTGRTRAYGLSCGALLVSLLCHEAAVSLPLVLAILAFAMLRTEHARGSVQERVRRALLAVIPAASVSLVYLAYRHAITRGFEAGALYDLNLSLDHVTTRYLKQARHLVGGAGLLAFLAAVVLGCGAWLFRARPWGGAGLRWLIGGSVVCLVWAALALGPMVLLPTSHLRFSSQATVPMAIFFGIWVHAVLEATSARWTSIAQLFVLVLVVAVAPWAALLNQIRNHNQDFVREAAFVLEAARGSIPDGGRIAFLAGVSPRRDGPSLATGTALRRFKFYTYGGKGLVDSVFAEQPVGFGFIELGGLPSRRLVCEACRYFAVNEDLSLEEARPEWVVKDVLMPALTSGRRALIQPAVVNLVRLDDSPEPSTIVASCGRTGDERCVHEIAAALREQRTPRATRLANLLEGQAAKGAIERPAPASDDPATVEER